jgi:hypothetical protein
LHEQLLLRSTFDFPLKRTGGHGRRAVPWVFYIT